MNGLYNFEILRIDKEPLRALVLHKPTYTLFLIQLEDDGKKITCIRILYRKFRGWDVKNRPKWGRYIYLKDYEFPEAERLIWNVAFSENLVKYGTYILESAFIHLCLKLDIYIDEVAELIEKIIQEGEE